MITNNTLSKPAIGLVVLSFKSFFAEKSFAQLRTLKTNLLFRIRGLPGLLAWNFVWNNLYIKIWLWNWRFLEAVSFQEPKQPMITNNTLSKPAIGLAVFTDLRRIWNFHFSYKK